MVWDPSSKIYVQMIQSPSPFGNPGLRAIDTMVDTIRVVDQQEYIDLLEKTNQQMSYWWGPLGAAIAFLGLLFAVGAIVAGYLLYRQSRDYRVQLAEVLAASQAEVTGAVARYETIIADLIATTNSRIEGVVSELQERAETATEERKAEIEKEIGRLRDSLIPPPTPQQFRSRPEDVAKNISSLPTHWTSLGSSFATAFPSYNSATRAVADLSVGVAQDLDRRSTPCPGCGTSMTWLEWLDNGYACKHCGTTLPVAKPDSPM